MPHIHYALDLVVDVYIVFNNRVLLRRHDKSKKYFGVGGHIEANEDLIEAAKREVWEEVGLEIELFNPYSPELPLCENYNHQIPPCFMNRHKASGDHDHVSLVFFGIAYSDKIQPQHESDKSDDCLWLTEAELETLQDVRSMHKVYAQEALKANKLRVS